MRKKSFMKKLKVGVPGLEPGKAGPESAVLPITPYPKQEVYERYALEYGCKSSAFRRMCQIISAFFSENGVKSKNVRQHAVCCRTF